ncbi:MAG TPA: 50S ribosomal protein L10 [Solirubrobacteraceae bacterium]
MNRDQKSAVVDEIAEQIERAEAIFAVDYRGLTVTQAADLRAQLRGADAKLRVVKNSLSERAADKAGAEALKPMLQGPTALALVNGDAAVAAKALSDAARSLHILEFKGGLLNGTTLSAEDVRSIARLPARDVLNAQLVGTIAAPLSGLVRGLNALIVGIAVQLQAIADQGLVSGTAPEPEPAATEAAEPEPEPEAAEPEPEAAEPEAESVPEPEPAAEAAPEAAAEPEPEAAPEAAPAVEADPQPDPATEKPEPTEAEAASDAEPSDA